MKRYRGITGACFVSPAKQTNWAEAVPPAMKRRDARLWQMAYAAAKKVIDASGVMPQSIIVGTALGALEETRQFLDGVYTDGLGSPRNFIASVHNSMAGKLALEFKISGPNLTVTDSHNSFASAIITADLLADACFPVLLCVADERIALLDELRPHLSKRCLPYMDDRWEEGAAAFILTAAPSANETAVRAFGPFPAERRPPEDVCKELLKLAGCDFPGEVAVTVHSTSFVQPAISAVKMLEGDAAHGVIGSFSPTTGAVAVVELRKAPRGEN